MAHSSLLGIDDVAATPAGRDNEALGPSDTSDSGSDVAGLATLDADDPNLPVDVALDADRVHADPSSETLGEGADSDAGGSGERRSAGGDAGLREAADIAPDRVVFDPNGERDAEGALDDRPSRAPRPRGGVAALDFASAGEAGDLSADAAPGGDPENDEVEPPAPGGNHPKAVAPARRLRTHDAHPGRRERDHGLSGPDPDVPAQAPPADPNDEGVNDEGDDTTDSPDKP